MAFKFFLLRSEILVGCLPNVLVREDDLRLGGAVNYVFYGEKGCGGRQVLLKILGVCPGRDGEIYLFAVGPHIARC